MTDVISFFFDVQRQVWTLVVNNWIIAIFVLINVLGLVISLVNSTRSNQG